MKNFIAAILFAAPLTASAIIPPCEVLKAQARQEYDRRKSEAASPLAHGPLALLKRDTSNFIFFASAGASTKDKLKAVREGKATPASALYSLELLKGNEMFKDADFLIKAGDDSLTLTSCTFIIRSGDPVKTEKSCVTVDLKKEYREQATDLTNQVLALSGMPETSADESAFNHVPKYCQQPALSIPAQNLTEGTEVKALSSSSAREQEPDSEIAQDGSKPAF